MITKSAPERRLNLRKTFSLLFFLAIATLLKAEIKKDTLVNRAWRDTVRLQKAQVFDFNDNNDAIYFRSKPFQFFKYVPSDVYHLGKAAFSKKNLPVLGGILAGSALLLIVDQPVTDAVQQFGRYINLDPARKSKTLIQFNLGNFHMNALEIPDNTNSAIYYLGEGWTSMIIAGGLYSYGLAGHDYRAVKTSSEITEMIFTLGVTTQFLKRLTGRQSPFRAMSPPPGVEPVPGGDWHPFISWSKYQKSVSNYDAFPSGHFATAMATITILAGNYPDNKYIKPVGYSLMGILGLAMINHGVHWLSDYPLAIAIGYTAGKIAVKRGHILVPKLNKKNGATSMFMPTYLGQGAFGMSYRMIF